MPRTRCRTHEEDDAWVQGNSQLHCFSRITFPFFLTLVLKILQIFEQNFVWIDSLTPPPKITCRISGTWVARWHWSSGRTCPRNHRLSASEGQARLLPALVTDANSSLQLCSFHWSAWGGMMKEMSYELRQNRHSLRHTSSWQDVVSTVQLYLL